MQKLTIQILFVLIVLTSFVNALETTAPPQSCQGWEKWEAYQLKELENSENQKICRNGWKAFEAPLPFSRKNLEPSRTRNYTKAQAKKYCCIITSIKNKKEKESTQEVKKIKKNKTREGEEKMLYQNRLKLQEYQHKIHGQKPQKVPSEKLHSEKAVNEQTPKCRNDYFYKDFTGYITQVLITRPRLNFNKKFNCSKQCLLSKSCVGYEAISNPSGTQKCNLYYQSKMNTYNYHSIENLCVPKENVEKMYPNMITSDNNVYRYKKEKDKLGEGTYGTVYQGVKINKFGSEIEDVAIKIQKLNDGYVEGIYMKKLNQENPNKHIMKLIEVIPECYSKKTYIIMEYCKGGTLSNISKKNYANEKTYEAIVKNIFLQIVKAVQYMHEEKNIIHGDLKLENILLKTNDVNFADVKITDFGLSFSDQIEKEEARPKKSSPLYNAPELQCGFRISEKTDIWAIGVILYNLLFDSFPFDINRCETLKELDQKICSKTLNFPIGNDSEKFKNAKDLITNILQKDPKQRYSINQILDHQWITKKQG